ncbi:hypothetical protein SAMN05444162_3629 [Paenibacillaceae bacterium GAS479]|nr:hypothetical protein SAMN05444162_3629 [Paenibacillaceae bacterium GAS479]
MCKGLGDKAPGVGSREEICEGDSGEGARKGSSSNGVIQVGKGERTNGSRDGVLEGSSEEGVRKAGCSGACSRLCAAGLVAASSALRHLEPPEATGSPLDEWISGGSILGVCEAVKPE